MRLAEFFGFRAFRVQIRSISISAWVEVFTPGFALGCGLRGLGVADRFP